MTRINLVTGLTSDKVCSILSGWQNASNFHPGGKKPVKKLIIIRSLLALTGIVSLAMLGLSDAPWLLRLLTRPTGEEIMLRAYASHITLAKHFAVYYQDTVDKETSVGPVVWTGKEVAGSELIDTAEVVVWSYDREKQTACVALFPDLEKFHRNDTRYKLGCCRPFRIDGNIYALDDERKYEYAAQLNQMSEFMLLEVNKQNAADQTPSEKILAVIYEQRTTAIVGKVNAKLRTVRGEIRQGIMIFAVVSFLVLQFVWIPFLLVTAGFPTATRFGLALSGYFRGESYWPFRRQMKAKLQKKLDAEREKATPPSPPAPDDSRRREERYSRLLNAAEQLGRETFEAVRGCLIIDDEATALVCLERALRHDQLRRKALGLGVADAVEKALEADDEAAANRLIANGQQAQRNQQYLNSLKERISTLGEPSRLRLTAPLAATEEALAADDHRAFIRVVYDLAARLEGEEEKMRSSRARHSNPI